MLRIELEKVMTPGESLADSQSKKKSLFEELRAKKN